MLLSYDFFNIYRYHKKKEGSECATAKIKLEEQEGETSPQLVEDKSQPPPQWEGDPENIKVEPEVYAHEGMGSTLRKHFIFRLGYEKSQLKVALN